MFPRADEYWFREGHPYRSTERPGVKGMYLSTFEGHGDLQCAWVRESDMSKDAKDWWRLESELRYPGYSDADYPCYDDKENSLGHSLSSGEFLRCLPLALLDSPAPEQSFMELVANPGFNAWNFVLALIGETSFELFFRLLSILNERSSWRKSTQYRRLVTFSLKLLFAVCGYSSVVVALMKKMK